ncbi:hypothetical protein BDV95DRAFT_654916 [Massariosphaeria phaeospora]|uniref:SET domain-containing protein n=1 Tax=Massariosphaeria phaeospora TaxID=100035 RepID=A0A7C8MSE1_9PLEO|nr:hypothetical protein BDV95DRAFT_654916 [Massariosphaeria phaeospora]
MYSVLTLVLLTIPHVPFTLASAGNVRIDELLLQQDQQRYIAAADNADSPHAPWSHKPWCTHSTFLRSVGQKYCVYTSNTTGPNGISLITTPKTAARAAPLLDEDPLSHFLTQTQAETLYYNPAPYEIVDIPGKDKGVVATRLIAKFETFMIDQASVFMDLHLEQSVGEKENLKLLKMGVERLRSKEVVRELSDRHKGADGQAQAEDEVEGELEEKVMMTNSFGTTIANVAMRGVFPVVSRINHACDPSAFVLFSTAGISIAVKAYRDIQPGEEISISYLTLGQPSPKRRAGLQTRWGFTCTCALCSLPTPQRMASDLRRAMISDGEEKAMALWAAGSIREAIALAEESVGLIGDEGLEPLLTDEFALLAKLHLVLGEREEAARYGARAVELLRGYGFLGVGEEERGDGDGDGRGEKWDLESLLDLLGTRRLYDN